MLIIEWFFLGFLFGAFLAAMAMIGREVLFGNPEVNEQVREMRQLRKDFHRSRLKYRIAKFLYRNPELVAMRQLRPTIKSFVKIINEENKKDD